MPSDAEAVARSTQAEMSGRATDMDALLYRTACNSRFLKLEPPDELLRAIKLRFCSGIFWLERDDLFEVGDGCLWAHDGELGDGPAIVCLDILAVELEHFRRVSNGEAVLLELEAGGRAVAPDCRVERVLVERERVELERFRVARGGEELVCLRLYAQRLCALVLVNVLEFRFADPVLAARVGWIVVRASAD